MSTMRKVAFGLPWLACTTMAWRAQTSMELLQGKHTAHGQTPEEFDSSASLRPLAEMAWSSGRESFEKGLKSQAVLAMLLLASDPSASFSPSGVPRILKGAANRQANQGRSFSLMQSGPAPSDDPFADGSLELVLRPSSPAEATWFDSGCVANPVVLPPSVTGTGKWQCYYYGNAGSWAAGATNFLPTGWTGLAESDDGIHWTKVVGKEEGGSIMAPTGNPEDWDGIHLGVGDVIRVSDSELHMYYFGGSGEDLSLGPNRTAKGLRMRIGRARSTDGGRTWERMGMVLDYDQEEGLFASWPRIMLPDPREKGKEEPWKMIYHAFNGRTWSAFGATSLDQGETWTRDGLVLGPGEPDGWDGSGVGTRAVARTKTGEWIMVYEAVDGGQGAFAGKHRLGVARLVNSADNGKSTWEKDTAITGVPGGPILDPGVEPLEPWTSQVIGTPYLVAMEDGSLRLYFCSKRDPSMNMSIGLVMSATGDVSPSSWSPVSP